MKHLIFLIAAVSALTLTMTRVTLFEWSDVVLVVALVFIIFVESILLLNPDHD